jgi:thymidylate synthase (FAD)
MVKLISITMPVKPELRTPEDIIVYCARVSNPKNQLNLTTGSDLLKYCLVNKHFSIFETVNMTIEIETSRAIAAQLLRHRSFVFQEHSQRYSSDVSFEKYEARRQDSKNRQNSIDDMCHEDRAWFQLALGEIQAHSLELYEEALKRGIAKEQSRMLLPLSTSTRLYMTGNVRSFITYLMVRLDKSTQLEHRQIAEEIKQIFIGQFPNIAVALEWND